MYIKNTKNHQSHPAPHKKGGNKKKKNQTSERAIPGPSSCNNTHHAPRHFYFPALFFPSFHSHSTTKKEKSLKYDRNAPLRRPRSLDSTEAVLQIGGFFLKNVPGGIFDFCSTKPIYLSGETLSRWRGGYCISPGSPAQNTFL